jgi:hypothetical protein
MIYVLSTAVLVPGKMAEYGEIASKEALPLYPKMGMKEVASWHGYTGNMNENYTLFVYPDLAAFQKAVEARTQNKDYQKIAAKLNALRVSQTSTILEPNAWSPMK